MKIKKTKLLLLCLMLTHVIMAQLQNVAAITSRVRDSTMLTSGVHAFLNTKDFGVLIHPSAPPTWETSLQLVDVVKPYPPIIYQTGSENVNPQAIFFPAKSDFYTDLKIQSNGQLTYVCDKVPHGTASGFFDPVRYDTATLSFIKADVINNLDGHDYRVNNRGEVLYASIYLDTLDISCLSGTPGDTAVVQTQQILIKDSNNVVIFSWRPFDGDFSPCEMRYFTPGTYTTSQPLDWSHFNSANWSNDSNIIVSFRETSCFKINRQTGHVEWKLGGLDPQAIPVADSIMYFAQHDFEQLPDGRYSIYSDGDNAHRYMEGLMYTIDEVNKSAHLSDRYQSTDTGFSIAMGSYRQYNNDLRFLNYGLYVSPVQAGSPPNLFCDILDSNDHLLSSLVSPFNQVPYRVVPTAWSPEHLRPRITEQGTVLTASLPSTSRYYDIKWYDMPNDSTSALIDSGLVLSAPIAGHTYVADAYIDSNTNLNWRITSLPFLYAVNTGVQEANAQDILRIMPNPARGRFHILNDGKPRVCELYNDLGMYIRDLTVKCGDNVYEAPTASGVYIIRAKNESEVYRLIVY